MHSPNVTQMLSTGLSGELPQGRHMPTLYVCCPMRDPNKAQQFLIPIQPATYGSQLGDRGAVNIVLWWTNFAMSFFVVDVLSQLAARNMAIYLPKWEVRE